MKVFGSADGSEVVLRGRLDVQTVADVRLALHEAIDAGAGPLVLDLSAAEIMDATGLGVLIGGHRRAERAGRTLVLRSPSERLLRLLVAMRLHRILHVEQSDGLAVSAPATSGAGALSA